jgi:hypothetical protein
MRIAMLTGALVLCLTTGCEDARIANLEKRVSQLEEKNRQLESNKEKSSEESTARQVKLENCVAQAEAEFQKDVVGNGTKTRNGLYSVPVPVQSAMESKKRGKIEECRLLYGK